MTKLEEKLKKKIELLEKENAYLLQAYRIQRETAEERLKYYVSENQQLKLYISRSRRN